MFLASTVPAVKPRFLNRTFSRALAAGVVLVALACRSSAPGENDPGPCRLASRAAIGSWALASFGLTPRPVRTFAVDATIHAIFAGTDVGVVKTSDGGQTWTPTGLFGGLRAVGALAVSPSAPTVIYASAGDSLLKSMDDGATWQ